jgi:hypothetical protein
MHPYIYGCVRSMLQDLYHTFLQKSFSLLAGRTLRGWQFVLSFQSVAAQFVKLFFVLVVWMAIGGLSTVPQCEVTDQES